MNPTAFCIGERGAGQFGDILRALRRGLRFLIAFAIEPSYQLLHTTKRQAQAALRWAGAVRHACCDLLSL
jgi:hypothetical protein